TMARAARGSVARALPVEPLYPQSVTPARRRRVRPDALRFRRSLLAMGAVATALVLYVFSCAVLAQTSYSADRLRLSLKHLQEENQMLQGQVLDLRRIDRILLLSKQQGMVPRDRLRYVKLLPPPDGPAFQQASAQP
ncbi:MAG: hypothetical protein QHJ73_15335, partial [Armatimonadota bacterium]|nr:hypothetical protein [Armatimonadota bacterium]